MPQRTNGIGTGYIGQSEHRPDGSYITSEWFTILYIPIFPLRCCRIVRTPSSADVNLGIYRLQHYNVIERIPLSGKLVGRIYALTFLYVAWVWFLLWLLYSRLDHLFALESPSRLALVIGGSFVPFVIVRAYGFLSRWKLENRKAPVLEEPEPLPECAITRPTRGKNTGSGDRDAM
jgi:hypothetical protein